MWRRFARLGELPNDRLGEAVPIPKDPDQ